MTGRARRIRCLLRAGTLTLFAALCGSTTPVAAQESTECATAGVTAGSSAEIEELLGSTEGRVALNNRAWSVFERSNDREELCSAIGWMQGVLERSADDESLLAPFSDTYANLLYKVGRVQEAIAWEEKAIAATDIPDLLRALNEALEKMKKGEPTWPSR